MNKFIKVTRKLDGYTGDDTTAWRWELVNVSHIVRVIPRDAGGTYLEVSGDMLQVVEQFDEIAAQLPV